MSFLSTNAEQLGDMIADVIKEFMADHEVERCEVERITEEALTIAQREIEDWITPPQENEYGDGD